MDAVWFGIPAVPVIVALIELVKRMGLPSRFAGIVAAITGIIGGLVTEATAEIKAHTLTEAGFLGLLAGLGAAGLYSAAKAVAKGSSSDTR